MRRLSTVVVCATAAGVIPVLVGMPPVVVSESPVLVSKTTTPTLPPPTTGTTPVPTSIAPSVTTPSTVAMPTTLAVATGDDNDHLFTFGEIAIPPGRPGQLSVVTANSSDSGAFMIVVRNDRPETVYGIVVAINGTDASGAETFSTLVIIETAGLEPGDWAFGQADFVPRLELTTDFGLQFIPTGEPGDILGLDVSAAQFSGDAIVGAVINPPDGLVVDTIQVNVACFDRSGITAYQRATADAEILNPGDSANFRTPNPIDLSTCAAFAVFATGLPVS